MLRPLFPKIIVSILILCNIFLLTGCNQAMLETSAARVPQLIQSVLSDPKTFNPVLSQESPNVFGLIYEGLVTENPLTGDTEPALAKSWQISEDGLTITFTLREGLKWSDGHPLTADDVIFTYNDLYLNEEIPSGERDILRIGESGSLPKVTKLDNLHVQFKISEPFAPFLSSSGLPILPAHVLRPTVYQKDGQGKPLFLSTWGVDTKPLKKIVVNGAYQLHTYASSQRVIFNQNPYYWKQDTQGNSLPYIKRIVWKIVESTDTSLLQFRSGSLDSISVSPDYFSLLKKEEKRGNFTIYNGGPAYGTTFISFNLNKATRKGKPLVDPIKSRWFNNVNFRRAIAYSIDRQRMINNIFRGLGEKQNSPISVQSPFYDSQIKGYDYNPDKAQELLLKEGFKYNEKNLLVDADNNEVRFTLITNAGNKIREAMVSQIKQDLAKIGIQVDLNLISFNVFVDKLSNSLDWECHLLGFTGGNEPNNGANVWSPDGSLHSFNQKAAPGTIPIEGRIVEPWEQKIGDLYIQAARELDKTKRKEIYAQTQRLTEKYLPYIYLVNPLSLSAVRNKFIGIKFSALGGAFWNIDGLQIQPMEQLNEN